MLHLDSVHHGASVNDDLDAAAVESVAESRVHARGYAHSMTDVPGRRKNKVSAISNEEEPSYRQTCQLRKRARAKLPWHWSREQGGHRPGLMGWGERLATEQHFIVRRLGLWKQRTFAKEIVGNFIASSSVHTQAQTASGASTWHGK
jgi:hypothetical protein